MHVLTSVPHCLWELLYCFWSEHSFSSLTWTPFLIVAFKHNFFLNGYPFFGIDARGRLTPPPPFILHATAHVVDRIWKIRKGTSISGATDWYRRHKQIGNNTLGKSLLTFSLQSNRCSPSTRWQQNRTEIYKQPKLLMICERQVWPKPVIIRTAWV